LNDERVSEEERQRLLDWLGGHLETPVGEARIGRKLLLSDEATRVSIYEKEFGTPENPWYISRW